MKKSYIRYLYHKKQYILAKQKKPLNICKSRVENKQTADLFGENPFYISSKHDLKEVGDFVIHLICS